MSGKHLFQMNYQIAKEFNFENVQIFLLYFPMLVISNVEDAKKVLLNWKEFPKAANTNPSSFFQRFLGENLVFVNHEQWRTQRSIMNPAFYTIDRFGPLFTKEVFKCLKAIQIHCHKSNQNELIVPIAKFTTALALDVLGLAAFNFKFNMLSSFIHKDTNSSKEYVDAYHYIMSNITDIRYMFGNIYSSLPLEKNKKIDQSITKMDELVFSLIEKAKQDISNKEHHEQSLLDMMIESTDEQSGKHMTDKELRDNIMVFFLAGHDTTSAALAACLFSLAKNQHVQEKLIEEIDQAIGTDLQKPFDMNALDNIEYLEWVIKETLRMYPPVVQIPMRRADKNEQIGTSIKVKKGTLIGINVYNIHHNPLYWPEPFEFRPERFSEEESKNRPTMAWIPFGAGARLCIGKAFSILEQRIFLCALLQRYTVHLQDVSQEYQFLNHGVLFSPDPKMNIVLKARE
jgi:cytochrome P450